MRDYLLRLQQIEIVDEIKARICRGDTADGVVDYIYDSGYMHDCAPGTLLAVVKELRKTIPMREQAKSVSVTARRAAEIVDYGLDVLEELRSVYAIQRERIDIDLEIERASGHLLPLMHKEVKQAADILKVYAQVQMDFGLIKRQLGTIDVNQGPEVHNVTNASHSMQEALQDPKRRHKLITVLGRVMALEKKALDVESTVGDEDGAVDDS